MMHPIPINDAEAVIEPFFDGQISNLADSTWRSATEHRGGRARGPGGTKSPCVIVPQCPTMDLRIDRQHCSDLVRAPITHGDSALSHVLDDGHLVPPGSARDALRIGGDAGEMNDDDGRYTRHPSAMRNE